MNEPNVFTALYQYGPYAAENYLTESLVFLFRTLLQREPMVGLSVLNRFCGPESGLGLVDAGALSLSTQVTVEEGRPDIEISAPGILVYVEVKHDAPLGPMQLERYYGELQNAGVARTSLILLTRSRLSASATGLAVTMYHHVCWYQLYNWLLEADMRDEVCSYFVRTFLRFLEEKSMSLPRVSWQYIDGIKALFTLTNMLETAISEGVQGANIKRTGGWNWRGFYVNDAYFTGVRYDNPLVIVFENNKGVNPTYKPDLNLEKVHFFSLTKDEQFEAMVAYVRKAFSEAPASGSQIAASTG